MQHLNDLLTSICCKNQYRFRIKCNSFSVQLSTMYGTLKDYNKQDLVTYNYHSSKTNMAPSDVIDLWQFCVSMKGHLTSKLNSKTVPVLHPLKPSLIYSFHPINTDRDMVWVSVIPTRIQGGYWVSGNTYRGIVWVSGNTYRDIGWVSGNTYPGIVWVSGNTFRDIVWVSGNTYRCG